MQKYNRLLTGTFLAILFAGMLLFFVLPKADFSEDEKRALQAVPTFSASAAADGSLSKTTEAYLADHFPGRKELVGLHSYFDLLCGRNGENGVYRGRGGWLMNVPVTQDPMNFRQNLNAITDFTKQEKLPASLLVVPTTGYIMDDKLPQIHAEYPDSEMLGQAKAQTAGAVQWVDLSARLMAQADSGEQLYYRTDHHWTTRGAYLGYKIFAASQGFAPRKASDFQIVRAPGFYGTAYSKSGFWDIKSDTLELWKDPTLQVRVEIREDGKKTVQNGNSLYFPEQLKKKDHYPVFLNGNHSLVRVMNPQASGGRLLLVKDSYANCLTPFLAEHYRQIDLVDLRYYHKNAVSDLVKQDHLDSILFCYGLDDLIHDSNLALLA